MIRKERVNNTLKPTFPALAERYHSEPTDSLS